MIQLTESIHKIDEIKRFIVIFYVVGLLGFTFSFTRPLFTLITPFALLLNVLLLAFYHEKYSIKTIVVFFLIFLLGYIIEVIGVKTGKIFGTYYYGNALGIKIFNTPLLIGVNWLFLTYCANSIISKYHINEFLILILVPFIMVLYDIILEYVAPKLNMWSWENNEVPMQNYLAWFIIAFVFNLLIRIFQVETKNPLATYVFISQFLFFILLNIIL